MGVLNLIAAIINANSKPFFTDYEGNRLSPQEFIDKYNELCVQYDELCNQYDELLDSYNQLCDEYDDLVRQ